MLICLKNSYGTIDKSFQIGPAIWPHFDLIFVHSGQIQLKLVDEKQIFLNASKSVLIYPDTAFRGYATVANTRISVHHFSFDVNVCFQSFILDSLISKKTGFEIYHQQENDLIERLIEQSVKLAYEKQSKSNEDIRRLAMTLLVAELRASTTKYINAAEMPQKAEIDELIVWMRENLDKKISLDEMAEKIGLSTSHFRDIFKRQIGTSPANYFMNMRINKAAKLLRETLVPIKKIALLVGYDDIPNFYRAFNSFYGVAPNAYRDKNRLWG